MNNRKNNVSKEEISFLLEEIEQKIKSAQNLRNHIAQELNRFKKLRAIVSKLMQR
jgi:hypothetical protein